MEDPRVFLQALWASYASSSRGGKRRVADGDGDYLRRGTLADYFVSMLSDVDRAKKYEDAIRAVVREWFDDHRPADGQPQQQPVVMDVGSGTGLLTLLALKADERVTVVATELEENQETIEIMEQCLDLASQADASLKDRYTVVRGRTSGVVQALRKRCDIIVSEILGSFISSEEAFKFLPSFVRESLRSADGDKLYMVPRRCIQSARLYRFDGASFNPSEFYALQKVLHDAATKAQRYLNTGVSALGVQLDAFEHRQLCTSVLRVESYTSRRAVTESGFVSGATPLFVPAEEGEVDEADEVFVGFCRRFGYKRTDRSRFRDSENRRCAPDGALELTSVEWDVELWDDVYLENSLAGYARLRLDGDPISPIGRNEAWGVFVFPYTIDLTGTFEPKTGNFAMKWEASKAAASFQLLPYVRSVEHETPRERNTTTKRKKRKDDDDDEGDNDDFIEPRNAGLVFDRDLAERLAEQGVRAARADGNITKVYVLNDPTAGVVATAFANSRPDLAVTCLYDKEEMFLLEVSRMALSESVHNNITVREHEPRTGTAKRTRGAAGRLTIANNDDSVLLLLPRWLDPDFDAAKGPTFEGLTRVPAIAARDTRHPKKEWRVRFQAPLMNHGLGFCGVAALFTYGLAPMTYLKKCTTLAFTADVQGGGDEEGVAVVVLDEPRQGNGVLPGATLQELRRLCIEKKWVSLFARGLLAGSIVVGVPTHSK